MAERAIERARSEGLSRRSRRRRDSFEYADQIWVVFDRDQHPRFDEAIGLCNQHGVRIGRSNPCFELWLVLHEQDHDRYENRRAVQELLGRLRPEYDEDRGKIPNCTEMLGRVEEAERRAEILLQRRREGGDPYGNPSTTVGHLTREIRRADEGARPLVGIARQ